MKPGDQFVPEGPGTVIATLATEDKAPAPCPDEIRHRDPVCVAWEQNGKRFVGWVPGDQLREAELQ